MSNKYLSPGVRATERDLSTYTTGVSTSTGALVGYSPKGSLEPTFISNKQQFIEEYGKPNILSSYFHYTALGFLENGRSLYCQRVTGTGPLYSGISIVRSESSAHRPFDVGQSTAAYYDQSGWTSTVYGDNLAVNGDFALSTTWSYGTDWSYNSVNKYASYECVSSVDSNLLQVISSVVSGTSYRVRFRISEFYTSSGTVTVNLGGDSYEIIEDGDFDITMTPVNDTGILAFNFLNATAGDTVNVDSVSVQEITELENDDLFSILAKNPGEWGDDISITISDVKEYYDPDNMGNVLDTTEQYTFVINVYYTDSEGNTNKVEAWKVSRQSKVDGYGKQLYLTSKINGYSNYIVVADSTMSNTVLPLASSTALNLAGGYDGAACSYSDIVTGWDAFVNPDDIDVQILIDGGHTPTIEATSSSVAAIQVAMNTIAETRKDCIAILNLPYDECSTTTSVTDSLTYRNTTLNLNTSYSALYGPWVKINDSYNDRIVDIPPAGYVASHYALTDSVRNVWWAPAGFDRGTLNVLGLSYVYTEGQRDQLYPAGINSLQTFRGYGHVIYGQKTLQKKSSALDRVNVRRLLLLIEKTVVLTLRSFLFEPNNDLTRFVVKATLDEYFDRLSSEGAFQTEAGDGGYLVVCDTTNNTPAIIDANELHVDIFVKPSKAAEFIQLQMIVTKSGASFTELISRGTII